MNKIACSVPILTLNCKKNLERLLPAVVTAFDDVFIMDGNSTDGTQAYARSLGVRVEKQFETDEPNQRIEDFRSMRLRLWDRARCDWLLLLDSDMLPTDELIALVRRVVAEQNVQTAHEVLRVVELPDGRTVTHAFFYPNAYPHLFARSSGVTLADRAVHERLVFPPSVRFVRHTEAIRDPWPSAARMREKQMHYLSIEGAAMHRGGVAWWLRWIVWYNLRGFAGQLLAALRATLAGWWTRGTPLPWSYNAIFLDYRLRSLFVNTHAWLRARTRS